MVDLTNEQFEEVAALLADRWWRLCHLYWIVDVDGRVVRFVPNWAQQELYDHLHHRNDVLKVRQLGISTFVAILELDACLFTANITCGVIDRSLPEAKEEDGEDALRLRSSGSCAGGRRRKIGWWLPSAGW